jgi:hypothetical protein
MNESFEPKAMDLDVVRALQLVENARVLGAGAGVHNHDERAHGLATQ